MEKVTASIFQEKLDNLNGFLNLVTVDAAVEKDVQEDFFSFGSNHSAFDDLSWIHTHVWHCHLRLRAVATTLSVVIGDHVLLERHGRLTRLALSCSSSWTSVRLWCLLKAILVTVFRSLDRELRVEKTTRAWLLDVALRAMVRCSLLDWYVLERRPVT